MVCYGCKKPETRTASTILWRFSESRENIVQLFPGNEFDRGNNRLHPRGRGKFILMVFLDELADPKLYGAAHVLEIRAPDLHCHEAVEQGKPVIEIGAVDDIHQIPGLRRLRRLQHAADFEIGRRTASFIKGFVGFLACAGLCGSSVLVCRSWRCGWLLSPSELGQRIAIQCSTYLSGSRSGACTLSFRASSHSFRSCFTAASISLSVIET